MNINRWLVKGLLLISVLLFFFVQEVINKDFWKPKVSVITSLYKGKDFIKGFMEDIARQTMFNQCEFIIINAHSPDKAFEEEIIMSYVDRYPNIIYYALKENEPDPGLYGVWNMGIKKARGEYIINANVDDRLAPYALEILTKALDDHLNVDLVYAACYIGRQKNETFEMLHARVIKIILDWPEYHCPADMRLCLPGNHPMWRKSMHEKCGFFDEENYKAAGDWELFLRAVEKGCIFMKVPGVLGTFYQNATGLTQNSMHGKEMVKIEARYKYMWQNKVC